MAPRSGAARREAEEREVFRPVRTRVRDPGDARCADARLPRTYLLELVLRAARPRGTTVPVLRHRPMRRSVRPRGHRGDRGDLPWARRRSRRLPRRERTTRARSARPRDAGGGRPRGVRARREVSGPAGRRAPESQEMVLTQPQDLDVIGVADDDLEAAFQVFFVRRGRVKGRKGWVVDRVEDLDVPQLLASFVRELYMERPEVPPRILVPTEPADADVLSAWLAARRGAPVVFAVPERGAKRKLMDTVGQNARDHFQRHKLKRASDFGARSRALSELGALLGLEQAPLRIECYDVSNLGPTDKVGSMVVFEDGLPRRSDYRRFEIRGVPGQDDFASMEEMLGRRYARL